MPQVDELKAANRLFEEEEEVSVRWGRGWELGIRPQGQLQTFCAKTWGASWLFFVVVRTCLDSVFSPTEFGRTKSQREAFGHPGSTENKMVATFC